MGRNQNDEYVDISNFINIRDSGDSATEAVIDNGSETVTISNVAPTGVGTATISKWLRVLVDGTAYFIPMWT